MNEAIAGRTVLVTGATGTVGNELIRQLLKSEEHKPKRVVAVDNNESELFFLEQKFLKDSRLIVRFSDIRDEARLSQVMSGVDVVFHAAALKHVVVCERSPFDAVQTNINGVQNIISAAMANNVSKVIFTSTDKAVNPTNVMGTSKLMGERIITAANAMAQSPDTEHKCVFASTRFGNVLGSRGSVLPIFLNQISEGGPVTLTDPEMTRFVMTIEQAVELILDSAATARGGEVFVTKMPIVRISDLAKVMIEEFAPRFGYKPSEIKIEVIGTKPGEKLYEELMSDEETRRARELEDYFVVTPAFSGFYGVDSKPYPNQKPDPVTNPYNSSIETPMDIKAVKAFLIENGLLETVADNFGVRYWPGDKEEK